ncbi:MAG: hypothetical protein AAF721_10635 [Myxococcota bacterium]
MSPIDSPEPRPAADGRDRSAAVLGQLEEADRLLAAARQGAAREIDDGTSTMLAAAGVVAGMSVDQAQREAAQYAAAPNAQRDALAAIQCVREAAASLPGTDLGRQLTAAVQGIEDATIVEQAERLTGPIRAAHAALRARSGLRVRRLTDWHVDDADDIAAAEAAGLARRPDLGTIVFTVAVVAAIAIIVALLVPR